jgi:hypothetical protein
MKTAIPPTPADVAALRMLLDYASHETLDILLDDVARDAEALRVLLGHISREIDSDIALQFQKRPGYGDKLTAAQAAHQKFESTLDRLAERSHQQQPT